ncbi:MAG TPA: hypothetical protein VKT82_20260 [Ktedonobacterales bacterium]|nr:hypothetical protein [Ktedonobacterales bacterium]
MGGSLRQLTSRQLERLKSELAEIIIGNFCYPAFLDYRLNLLRTRPVDRRKRQEVWAYVNNINFNALGNMDVASMDFRRFVERAFLRYIDLNRALNATASARQVAAVRARVPQLALAVARGLADYLILSEASTFGQARLVESWGTARAGGQEATWEQIEKSTQVLQTTLVYLRTAGVEQAATVGSDKAYQENGATPDISDFPTRLLSPTSASHPLAAAWPASNGTAAGSAPLNQYAANGAHAGTDELAQLPPLGEAEAGARGQFRGPWRSPTASRPVDRPPTVSRPILPSDAQPSVSPDGTISRPIQPMPVVPPAPAPQPAEPPDAWQALLKRAEAEQPPAEAKPNGASAQPELPELDLPELPESFATPRVLELPPDLAELYGDYLRDSRAASLDLPGSSEEPGAADAQAGSAIPALPPSETDEEVDALFTALTNHIAAHDQAEKSAASQPLAGPPKPVDAEPSQEVTPPAWNGPQRTADKASGAAPASAPSSGQGEGQRAPAAPPKGMTDGDVMIFSQLQHQISTWVKMAAVSHQIDIAGRDAPELVEELRRTAALEEAELQVIESLVALCYRVTATKQATMDDYKQAMMLYLLHHRSRLAL